MRAQATTFERIVANGDLSAAASIRQHIAAEFGCLGAANDDAQLVLSELFANAVLHGRPPITVRATPFPGGVRLQVADATDAFGDQTAESRGLHLIDRLARGWGVEYGRGCKTVWA